MKSETVSDRSQVVSDDEIVENIVGETVPRDAFRKVLAQRKRDQEEKNSALVKLREYEQKLSAFEEKENLKRDEELKNRGEFEKILKSREEEILKYKQRETEIQRELQLEHSRQAFLSLLPGKLANPEYINLIPVNQVKYDASGDIDMKNLESLVENWKKSHFRLIDMPGSTAQLPNHSAERKKGLTHAEWLKLPIKEKKMRIGEVID